MKKIFLITGILTITQIGISQTTVGVQSDLGNITMHNGNAGSAITTFDNGNIKGSRYLFNTWTSGSVTDMNNVTYSNNYTFNFDKINQDLYAQYSQQQNMSVIIDRSKIKRFSIGQMNFINASFVDPKAKGVFYQVLVEDSNKISLYKLTTTKFKKADPTNIMNARESNFASEYVDDSKYYVVINKEMKPVNLTENSISKALKIKSDKVDAYFNMNSTKDIDEQFLINLIKYLNQ